MRQSSNDDAQLIVARGTMFQCMLQHLAKENLQETLLLHISSAPSNKLHGLNYGTNAKLACQTATGHSGLLEGFVFGAGALDVKIDRGYTPEP